MVLQGFTEAMHSATAVQGWVFRHVPCSEVGSSSRALFLGMGLRPVALRGFLSAETVLSSNPA